MTDLPVEEREDTLSERFRGKPDRDEPWRFVCPECDGQVWKEETATSYDCNKRHGPFDKSELVDKTVQIHD